MTLKIEFGENDGYLHADGEPRIFNFWVTGPGGLRQMFPCASDVTIGEFHKAAQAAFLKSSTIQADPSDTRPVEVARPRVVADEARASVIERNDLVKYIGKPDEAGELAVNGEYRVIEAGRDSLAIIDPTAPTPIRLTVFKSDVVLIEKGKRVTTKIEQFETTHLCTCGQVVAMVCPRGAQVYTGPCQCGLVWTKERGQAEPQAMAAQ